MRFALLMALTLATACARPLPPMTSVAQIARIDGECVLKRAGSPAWEPATEGVALSRGDRVWTKDGAARIRYAIGEVQELRDGTIVEIR